MVDCDTQSSRPSIRKQFTLRNFYWKFSSGELIKPEDISEARWKAMSRSLNGLLKTMKTFPLVEF